MEPVNVCGMNSTNSTTTEQDLAARSAARDHVAYGWTKRPGGWTGPAWTDEQREAYHDEFDLQAGRPGRYLAQVMVWLDHNPTETLRQAVRAEAIRLNTTLAKTPFTTYRVALTAAQNAVAQSEFAAYLKALGYH